MPENSSPPIDAGANMTRVEAWNAGLREGIRGYRGFVMIGLIGLMGVIDALDFPESSFGVKVVCLLAPIVAIAMGVFTLENCSSHLPHMERPWAFSLGVLTPPMIIVLCVSGVVLTTLNVSPLRVSLSVLGFMCGATLPLYFLINRTTSQILKDPMTGGLLVIGAEAATSLGEQYPLDAFLRSLGFALYFWHLPDLYAKWKTKRAKTKTRDPDTLAHDTGLTDAAGSMPDNASEGSQQVPASTLWWFFPASLVVYGAFLFFRTSEGPKNPPEALHTSMPLIAVVFGALALVMYHRSGGREAMAGPSGVVATSGVITWSLAEAVAICGLVAATLMAYPLSFLPYALASLALLLWTRPPAA